ncbi:hypothetical protein AMTRI_Chr11g154480 [Amborella trichopoda]
MRKRDVPWRYDTKVNDKGRVRCNFCNKEMGGGNVTGCKEVPSKVKQQIEKDVEEIGRGYESPIDEEEDQEAEFEGQMKRAGTGVRGPTAKELARPYLEVVVHDVDKHIAQFNICWPSTGVIIMTDGWKDKSHKYLVNFFISCPRGIVYYSNIDLSIKKHTGKLICAHLDKIVDEVGPENVVQVRYRVPYHTIDFGFFLNPQNLYSNATLDDVDIMEGVINCIYKLELDLETQMAFIQQIVVRILSQTCASSGCERNWSTFQWIHPPRWNRFKTQTLHNLVYILKLREKHTRRTSTDYTSINIDYIFRRDLAVEWVPLRTPLLDQDFFSGAVADMDDNVDVAISNKGDMAMDMDDDYTQDEDGA